MLLCAMLWWKVLIALKLQRNHSKWYYKWNSIHALNSLTIEFTENIIKWNIFVEVLTNNSVTNVRHSSINWVCSTPHTQNMVFSWSSYNFHFVPSIKYSSLPLKRINNGQIMGKIRTILIGSVLIITISG